MAKLRRWLALSALVAAFIIGLWGLGSAGIAVNAKAAAPLFGSSASVFEPVMQAVGIRRESVPPSVGPAPRTGPASLFKPLDLPNFGANIRANTDTQSPNLAQQEPSI